jgi:hypothetical protein
MKKTALIFLATVAFLSVPGCKSSTGPDTDDLVGTWLATKAEYVKIADSNAKVDIIAAGSTLSLVLSSSTFVLTVTDPASDPVISNGTWSKSIDTLTLVPTTGWLGESQFDMTLSTNHLTLTGGHMPFAFTPGNPEEAILNLNLVKQ